jgi:hypothetical protein
LSPFGSDPAQGLGADAVGFTTALVTGLLDPRPAFRTAQSPALATRVG